MATKKEAAKPKKKRVVKPKIELVSYSIKMVIPTGQYANVQPEIIVKAGCVKDAHDYIAPHMNKLWKEYYLINEKRPEIKVVTPPPAPVVTPVTPAKVIEIVKEKAKDSLEETEMGKPTPQNPQGVAPFPEKPEQVVLNESTPQPPESGVAFVKATQALNSCVSMDAYQLINNQIEISTKLTPEDKEKLLPLMDAKFKEIFAEEEKKVGESNG